MFYHKPRFDLNKKQRNGIFVLFTLIICLQFILYFWADIMRYLFPEKDIQLTQIEIFTKQVKQKGRADHYYRKPKFTVKSIPNKKIKLQAFNPNILTQKQWQQMGFSAKQSKAIIKYKNAIRGFEKKEDLKKLYVISQQKYKQLEKYIKIPDIVKKDINVATQKDLEQLVGIGKISAGRVIKFRDELRGFAHFKFLTSVYGLSKEQIKSIQKYFFVDASKVKKININNASFNQLKKFRYLNYKQAKSIVNFRENFRNFKSVEELLNLEGFKKKDIDKLKYYLQVN